MKNFKKILPSLCLIIFSTVLYAGNDVTPPASDQVLFGCLIQPIVSRMSPTNPYGPAPTNLSLSIVKDGLLQTAAYSGGDAQRFGLVFSGQGMTENMVGNSYVEELANKWRIIGHSGFNQCWAARYRNDFSFGNYYNVVGATCNPNTDGGDWSARDFYLSSATKDFTSFNGKRILNIRTAKDRIGYLRANLAPGWVRVDDGYGVVNPGDLPQSIEFVIADCRNREGQLVDPMTYNR